METEDLEVSTILAQLADLVAYAESLICAAPKSAAAEGYADGEPS